MTRYLRNGAVAGIGGGVALAMFLLLIGETSISDAIAIEEASGHGGDAMFTRSVQLVGGGVGSIIIGAALGAIFGIVFAATRHRLPGSNDWQRSLWLAAAAFVTIQLMPALKYPANPPAVGNPETVGERTVLYLLLVAFMVVTGLGVARFSTWLSHRSTPDHTRLMASAALWLALVAAGFMLFPPTPDQVNAPATLVWKFRISSLGGVFAFWTATGCTFGWLLMPHAVRKQAAKLTRKA